MVQFYVLQETTTKTLKSTYACVVVVVVVVVVVATNTSPSYVPLFTMQARNIDSFQWLFLSDAFLKKIRGFHKVTKNYLHGAVR